MAAISTALSVKVQAVWIMPSTPSQARRRLARWARSPMARSVWGGAAPIDDSRTSARTA